MHITELETTVEEAEKLGLTAGEFEKIGKVLGRTPNLTELYIYSVMWSEEASRKSSIKWLKTLPREGEHILRGPAGNGLIDLGDGLVCALAFQPNRFSGNNSEQQEKFDLGGPHYNMAAVGVRPVASFHTLRFGSSGLEDAQKDLSEVLKNIQLKGEKMGVPNLDGEVVFQTNQNISVDTFLLGVAEMSKLISAHAGAPGNPVYLVGYEGSQQDSGEVFSEEKPEIKESSMHPERRLLEACLESAQSVEVVGMHSITSVGIVFAAAKLCANKGLGMTVDLDKIPTGKIHEEAWEILSDTGHGLMMMVAKAGEEDALFTVLEKWELSFVQVGEVTEQGMLEFHHRGEKLSEVPVGTLLSGGGAPIYDHQSAKPEYLKEVRRFQLNQIKTPKDYFKVAKQLWASPNLAFQSCFMQKNNVFNLSEEMTQGDLCDARMVKVDGVDDKRLLVSVGGNSTYAFADPYAGTAIAVAEAARRIYCAGGLPVAITGCLKFGDPNQPEVYFQFTNAVKGMGDACRKLNIPVTGCEAKFFEETASGDTAELPIPAPIIRMVGLLEEPRHLTSIGFKNEGDCIYLIGNSENDLGSSEYLRTVQGIQYSPAPNFESYEEFEIHAHVHKLIRTGMVASAHSVSRGGLFTNLLESAVLGGLGFSVETVETFRKDCFLFGESQSRLVVSISPEHEDKLLNYLISNNVSFTKLGEVLGKEAVIDNEKFGSINDWKTVIDNKYTKILERKNG